LKRPSFLFIEGEEEGAVPGMVLLFWFAALPGILQSDLTNRPISAFFQQRQPADS
jgi:hypothetical protein